MARPKPGHDEEGRGRPGRRLAMTDRRFRFVMPALGAGTHAFLHLVKGGMDGQADAYGQNLQRQAPHVMIGSSRPKT